MSKEYPISEEIENAFTYHSPSNESIEAMKDLRETAKNLAYKIEQFCPYSREYSLAKTKLEECVMWANAAIVRYQ